MNHSISALSRSTSGSDAEEHTHFGANDIGWQALGPAIGCVLLSTAVVTARWIARRRVAQCEGLDDYVILLSLLLSWTMTALLAAQVNGGRGVYAGPIALQTIAKLVIASNVLWVLIVNITKASILIQYLRIFTSGRLRRTCYAFLAALLPAASWAIFGGVFLCTPTAKLWKPDIPGHCIAAENYWLSVASTDIGLDFLILALPIPSITALHLPRKQKQGLVLVFTLGFFVCIVSVVRLLTVLLSAHGGNYTASGIWAIVWSAVEANVGIICASLVSLKPLVVKFFPAMGVETKVPKYSMQIALIREGNGICDVWPTEAKEVSPSGSVDSAGLTPPSTARSGRNSSTATLVGSRFGRSPQPMAAPVTQPEPCAHPTHRRDETLSFFDMLKEDQEEANEHRQSLTKASSFVEHV